MSSAQRNTLGSSVFQQTLKSCGMFVLVSLGLLWLICGAIIWSLDSSQERSITESVTYGEDVYYGQGEEAVIEELIKEDDDVIWSNDYLYEVLENGLQVWVLRDSNYDPIAGFPGLHSDIGWHNVWLEHPDISEELRAYRVELRGGDTLTVAEFLPEDRANTISFSQFASVMLLLIVLPLSLITGYFLSQRVYRRIEAISATAQSVGSGQMMSRATESARNDEFDRLARSINQMLDQVETLNGNIEAVSVGVAHDLRTPLTNIGGRLELIRRDCADPDAVVAHVEAAEAAQSNLMRVFDALLRLGEVGAGRRKDAFAELDLSQLLSDMSEAFEPVFADADKTFRTDILTGVQITGDTELLEQMLANLFENALEHSRDAAKVFVRLARVEGEMVLTVGDDGPGISPANRDKVFDRFFRADSSRATPGNGLGLSLVKAIAELHGATVSLSPSANGAEFSISFPSHG